MKFLHTQNVLSVKGVIHLKAKYLECVIVDDQVALLSVSHPHRKTSVLKMDEAALSVVNEIENEMKLYVISDHCYQVSNIHVLGILAKFTSAKSCNNR